MGKTPNTINYSAIPHLDDADIRLLVVAFLSSVQFVNHGTFPQVDTNLLRDTANFGSQSSANTAWYELKKKLVAASQGLAHSGAGVAQATAVTAGAQAPQEVTTLDEDNTDNQDNEPEAIVATKHVNTTATSKTSSQSTDESNSSAELAAPELPAPKQGTRTSNRLVILLKVMKADDADDESSDTEHEKAEASKPRATKPTTRQAPLAGPARKKGKGKAAKAKVEELAPGASTYARHTRGRETAFGFAEELNVTYDDPEEQARNFAEDFGEFKFDDQGNFVISEHEYDDEGEIKDREV